ncbi:hypothetical protein OEK97_27810 [Escherichia coli]|uniref:hypothetical protein n=1 Tax=Escherichia coli TaxID=562 RepID=UPI0021D93D8E|nr:hypothetical protein [Escherichia coli]MCU9611723.1 hypothetical protein [Escherichia coli]
MKITDFKLTDKVTPISEKNHAYGKVLTVNDIWPIGRGGVDGRVIADGFSFMPEQLKIVN